MSSPSAPKPTQQQLDSEAQQLQASALLDQQENERRKRLLNAAAGVRAFAGSAITRAAPSDTANGVVGGAPSASQSGTAAASQSGSFVIPSGGGARGNSATKPF